jgi:hypothetical protein
LNFVEIAGLQEYVEFLRPETDLPNHCGRKTLSNWQYDSLQGQLLPGLGSKTRISIAINYSGSQNQLLFLEIKGHYISNVWQLRESLLGCEPNARSHTGWNLAQTVEEVLRN